MKKFSAVFIVCALLLCTVAGCSAAKDSAPNAAISDGSPTEVYHTLDNDVAYAEMKTSSESVAAGEAGTAVADSRKLIKTVSLFVQTKEYDKYLGAVRTAVAANGGYIEQSAASSGGFYDSGNRSSSITARIPSDKLDAFLASAGENGKIISQSEHISDITLDYVDTQSRLNALKTERESLTKLLAEASSLEGIIAVQTRLSEVNYQIESYESQLRVLDNQVSYSTVSLDIAEVERVSADDESLGQQIKTKLLNNLSDIKQDANHFAVAILGGLPYILIWGAAAVIALLIARVVIKKRRKKKAQAKMISPQ